MYVSQNKFGIMFSWEYWGWLFGKIEKDIIQKQICIFSLDITLGGKIYRVQLGGGVAKVHTSISVPLNNSMYITGAFLQGHKRIMENILRPP